jgi:hypothetical protein
VVGAPTSGWDWSKVQVSPLFVYRGHIEVFFGAKAAPGASPFAANANAIVQSNTVRCCGGCPMEARRAGPASRGLSRSHGLWASGSLQRGTLWTPFLSCAARGRRRCLGAACPPARPLATPTPTPPPAHPHTTPPLAHSPQDLTNLGTVLAVGDVNGDGSPDLLAGCPLARGDPALGTSAIQRGQVLVYYAGPAWTAGTVRNDTDADVTVYGEGQVGGSGGEGE